VTPEATEKDLDGILAIFNQVITTSTAMWIDDPTTKDERRQWMTGLFSKGYPIFVA
jgi:L-amino acid N-acyltransferase YncA